MCQITNNLKPFLGRILVENLDEVYIYISNSWISLIPITRSNEAKDVCELQNMGAVNQSNFGFLLN